MRQIRSLILVEMEEEIYFYSQHAEPVDKIRRRAASYCAACLESRHTETFKLRHLLSFNM